MRLSSNHEDLEFHHALIVERGDAHTYGNLQVLFSPLYIIEFVCRYSLDMQVVSTSTKVKGSDIRLKRERRGELRTECTISLMIPSLKYEIYIFDSYTLNQAIKWNLLGRKV